MKYVPFQSVQKHPNGTYWYIPTYDNHVSLKRYFRDWQIVARNQNQITLEYALTKTFLEKDISLRRKFYLDPREELTVDDLVFNLIYETDPYWCKDSLPATLQVSADSVLENWGHKLFVVGKTLQTHFYERDSDGRITYNFTLGEFADFVTHTRWQREEIQIQSLKHINFLKSLPSWETRLASYKGPGP